jgi:hypothetical protein
MGATSFHYFRANILTVYYYRNGGGRHHNSLPAEPLGLIEE